MDDRGNARGAFDLRRRAVLLTPLVLASAGCVNDAQHPPNPAETFIEPFQQMSFQNWGNLPQHSGEMATLYGDLNKPGPYLVMMRWHPGWFSAPHTYATDRICVVVSGTWFVNSGRIFRPRDAVPVGPGGYVKRTARTAHYDGVPAGQHEPAVIAMFGLGPVDIALVDPSQPSWRRVRTS
jgi:hypothetical protein